MKVKDMEIARQSRIMTQTDWVKHKLSMGEEITPMDAFEVGITRLAGLIWELRKQGYNITTTKKKGKSGCYYAVYSYSQD